MKEIQILFLIFISAQLSFGQKNDSFDLLISYVNNDNIDIILGNPSRSISKDGSFRIRMPISVTKPQEASEILDHITFEDVPKLISLLDNDDSDWAANIILYRISTLFSKEGIDCFELYMYHLAGVERWRDEKKEADIFFWKAWYEKQLEIRKDENQNKTGQ